MKDLLNKLKGLPKKAFTLLKNKLGVEMLFVIAALLLFFLCMSCAIPVPIPLVIEGPPTIEAYEGMIYSIGADHTVQ